MPRTMYDSIRATGMPADGDLYACYTDGLYSNEAAVRAANPGKQIVRISAIGRADADVIDIEPGCVWPPAAAAGWLAARPSATIYCGLAKLAAVVAALGTAHPYWVAHYTNTPHVCSSRCGFNTAGAHIVGTQYGGDISTPGLHYDVSAIYDDSWFSTGHAAEGGGTPITPVQPQEEDDMTPEQAAQLDAVFQRINTLAPQQWIDMHDQVGVVWQKIATGLVNTDAQFTQIFDRVNYQFEQANPAILAALQQILVAVANLDVPAGSEASAGDILNKLGDALKAAAKES